MAFALRRRLPPSRVPKTKASRNLRVGNKGPQPRPAGLHGASGPLAFVDFFLHKKYLKMYFTNLWYKDECVNVTW